MQLAKNDSQPALGIHVRCQLNADGTPPNSIVDECFAGKSGVPLASCGSWRNRKLRVSTCCRLRDAALSYQQPRHNLLMVTPRAESSSSNWATPGEVSRSPGTMIAHSRFSRNSFDLICHCPKDDDFASPIWTIDQCLTSARAAASSGNGPDRIKWLFPCTRMPTICFQASRRGSATG